MMNIKKFIKEEKGIIFCFIIIGIMIFFMFNTETIVTSILGKPENPFDIIRETEERVYINGTILHVEYIDWKKCALFLEEKDYPYYFDADAFTELKKNEGCKVTIMCYIRSWDGLYRLYACNFDWDSGYVKNLEDG